MAKRLGNIVQWVSIVVGITGMTLDKLIPIQAILSYVLIAISFAAFALLVAVQLLHRDLNKFVGKKSVDQAWHVLLVGANSSVDVFAGDVSWAQSNRAALAKRTDVGVAVRVLCRWPSTPILVEQVRLLLRAGVQVRYYDGDVVRVRGMVIDTRVGLDHGTALTVVKLPKERILPTKGQAGTDALCNYEARRYLPGRDLSYIAMLDQLFESVWTGLPRGMILDRLRLSSSQVLDILSRISAYRDLTVGDVAFRKVALDSLYSCCRSVKVGKLLRVSALVDGYEKFNLDYFESCRVEVDGVRRAVLPPILERQSDGKLVVVDGMHRIHHLIGNTDMQQAVCVVLSNAGVLPSTPVPFRDVRSVANKLPRAENFSDYRHEHFRDIKIVDRHLAELDDDFYAG